MKEAAQGATREWGAWCRALNHNSSTTPWVPLPLLNELIDQALHMIHTLVSIFFDVLAYAFEAATLTRYARGACGPEFTTTLAMLAFPATKGSFADFAPFDGRVIHRRHPQLCSCFDEVEVLVPRAENPG